MQVGPTFDEIDVIFDDQRYTFDGNAASGGAGGGAGATAFGTAVSPGLDRKSKIELHDIFDEISVRGRRRKALALIAAILADER